MIYTNLNDQAVILMLTENNEKINKGYLRDIVQSLSLSFVVFAFISTNFVFS